MKQRILHFMICIDQLIYSILTLGYASPIETISAAAYRWELENKFPLKYLRPLIDAIFWFDDDHCKESFENLKNMKYLPKMYQK